MKIIKATILLSEHSGDTILLHTDLPSSIPKCSDQNLSLDFIAEFRTGEEYVKTHFPGIPIEIIYLK